MCGSLCVAMSQALLADGVYAEAVAYAAMGVALASSQAEEDAVENRDRVVEQARVVRQAILRLSQAGCPFDLRGDEEADPLQAPPPPPVSREASTSDGQPERLALETHTMARDLLSALNADPGQVLIFSAYTYHQLDAVCGAPPCPFAPATSHQPSAISHQPSVIISHQPSVSHHQPSSAIRHQPSAIIHHQPSFIISHHSSSAISQPSAINHPPSAISHHQPSPAISHYQPSLAIISHYQPSAPLIICRRWRIGKYGQEDQDATSRGRCSSYGSRRGHRRAHLCEQRAALRTGVCLNGGVPTLPLGPRR